MSLYVLWLTRVFLDPANHDGQGCLTTDCTTINKNGLSRYRTKADNPDEQVWYINEPNSNLYKQTDKFW